MLCIMNQEMQPVRSAQGEPVQLTGEGINPTLRSEGNIFMADASNRAEQGSGIPNPGLDTSGLSPSQIRDALQVLQRLTPQQRRGLPIDEAREITERSRREAPHTGDRVRAQLGGEGGTTTELPSPKSASEILGGIRLSDYPNEELSRIAGVALRMVASNEVSTETIDRLRKEALEMRLRGADEDQFNRLDEQLRLARAATRRVEREIHDTKLIDLISQHPKLLKHLDKVNEFISKIKQGKYEEKDEEELKRIISAEMAPGSDRLHVDPVTHKVTISDLNPGDYTTTEQFDDFEYTKALLNATIADAVLRAIREGKVAPKEAEEAKKLARAMLLAATEGDSDEDKAKREKGYTEIEAVIENAQPESREQYSMIIESAIEQIQKTPGPSGEYRGEYDHIIEFVLEFGLERILSQADKAPQEDYPQFSLYVTDNIDRIIYMARIYDEDRARKYKVWNEGNGGDRSRVQSPDLFGYLVNLRSKRRTMHELFKGMKDPNTYLQYVTQLLRKTGFRFVEKDIAGVSDVQIIYEQVLGSALSLKEQGWLTDQDFEQADRDTAEILRQSARSKAYQKRMRKSDGSETQRELRDWEVGRAAMMGRSINAASQRRIVYAILGEIPKNPDIQYKSVESEYVARRLAPLKLLPDRFFGQPEAQELLRLIHEELKRDNLTGEIDWTKYGYTREDGTHVGLYGQSQNAADIIDLMITDPKSNSWRSRLMFLKQKDYANIAEGGRSYTIGHWLDNKWRQAEEHETDHKKQEKLFNESIRGVISKQRLFLGTLVRYPHLDAKNKAIIWQNAARFLPSRIAAFFPKETLELIGGPEGERMGKWIQIRNKLWTAERLRVKNDAEALRVGGSGIVKEISAFFQEAGIAEQWEIDVIEALQNFGQGSARKVKMPGAEAMANIKQPFTAFHEDAIKTDWEELSDEDFNRILVSDQNDFAEGYGHLVGFIGDPVMKPEDFVKAFKETKDKIQGPPGLHDAQDRLEAFVNAGLRFRRATTLAKLFGTGNFAGLRLPSSDIERFNLQARIAEDEEQQRDILSGLAQGSVIRDNPNDKDELGRTQYTRMLERNDADRKHQILRMFRLLVQLFGPIFAKTFLTTVFGNLKDLGLE